MPGTLLIVDDNARFRARARRWLEADGFEVVAEAADGASAMAAVGRHHPQVVLLDVRLPDMSGISVAEHLSRAPDPPAVVLTSTYDAAEFADQLETCGARGFVAKDELSAATLTAALG